MEIQKVADIMSPEVREKAETEATANGKSLSAFIEENISAELSEEALDAIASGATDIYVNVDFNPDSQPTVRGGVRIRF